jgi:hypothetical protein
MNFFIDKNILFLKIIYIKLNMKKKKFYFIFYDYWKQFIQLHSRRFQVRDLIIDF